MRFIIIVTLVFCAWDCKTQSLIPNGSFEQYIGCPVSWGQLDSVSHWYKPTYGTTDYYNTCSPQPGIKVPSASSGFQYPKTGNAYAGMLNTFGNTREYLAVKLTSTLKENISYTIICWINLANDSKYTVSKADIGIYFSKDSIGMPQSFGSQPLPLVPQVVAGNNTDFITDTLNWTELTFQYEAVGGERFMVFGLFGDDASITSMQLHNFGPDVYFYLDDFSMLPNEYAYDIKIDTIVYTSNCFSDSSSTLVRFQNTGVKALDFTVDTVTLNTEIKVNGATVQNFDVELNINNSNPLPNTPLAPDSFMVLEIFPVDLGRLGQVHEITVTTSFKRDEDPSNNQKSIKITPFLDVGELNISPMRVCKGDEVEMRSSNYIGEPNWQYSKDGQIWQDLPLGASATHHPEGSTYYRVEICGFLASDSVLVQVKEVVPPKDFSDTVCGGGFYELKPIPDHGIENLNWFTDTNAMHFHKGFFYSSYFWNSQIFYVQAIKDGCVSEEFGKVKLLVEECPLIIPNVFTPNGDSINDTFYFHNAGNKQLHTQIFDRWGEEVASWSGNQGWDGGELPEGIYYYVVREIYNGAIQKTQKGELTILR